MNLTSLTARTIEHKSYTQWCSCDAHVMLNDYTCTQRDIISTVEYQHIRASTFLHLIQGSYGSCMCLLDNLPTWSTTPVTYLLYYTTHTLKDNSIPTLLTNKLWYNPHTVYTYTSAYKKAEPRPTDWVRHSSHSETKKIQASTIMKFFNAQTIAVTVIVLMYCAGGKRLWLYLIYTA